MSDQVVSGKRLLKICAIFVAVMTVLIILIIPRPTKPDHPEKPVQLKSLGDIFQASGGDTPAPEAKP